MSFLIKHTLENITKFKNRTVFAPNGFGKTQFSLYLRDHFNNEGKLVGLYTRREIDDLVKITDNQIFVGNSASLLKRINDIKTAINGTNAFADDIRKEFTGKVSDYYGKSFFCAYNNYSSRTKPEKLLEIIATHFNSEAEDILRDDLYNTDQILNYPLFKRASDLLDKSNDMLMSLSDKVELPPELIEALKNLERFVSGGDIKKCPLCGYEYANHVELLKKIGETLATYISSEDISLAQEITSVCLAIKSLLDKRGSSYIREIFISLNYLEMNQYELVLAYVSFCNSFVESFTKKLSMLVITIDGISLKLIDVANEYLAKTRDLEAERKQIKMLGNGFSQFVISEINNLIDLDDASFKFDESLDTISIIENGKRSKKKCGEYFSESQLKRIGLIILRGYIRFLNYDYLILDDPIDSYDDYYLYIACDYISKTLNEANGTKWYLFTNNYNCLINLASLNKSMRFVVLNEHPDCLFGSVKKPPLEIRCSSRDVNMLNVNEMLLLSAYACKHPVVRNIKQSDFDVGSLPFLSFLVTLRNMRDIVHHHFDGITVGYCCPIFSDMVSSDIEHNFMHYDPSSSISTSLNRLYYIYIKILNPDNPSLSLFYGSAVSAVIERENVLKKPFSSFKGNKLLNLVFYKILSISYLKYLIEQKLIDGLRSFGISTNTIVNTNSLGKKIEKANKKALGNTSAENLVNKIKYIHKKYSTLINDYDHALAKMYPPYLSTSIKDIKKLKNDIDAI